MYVCPGIIYEIDERYPLDATIFIIINNSTCFGRLYAHHQDTGSSEPQPQHLVLNTIWSSIIRIQPHTPEDGHVDARNM